MPRLFNIENLLFQTFAVDSIDSDATVTASFAGVTTDDYVLTLQNNDVITTGKNGVVGSISAADKLVFHPNGAAGAGSSIAQTVGIVIMVNPTSGQEGGSW
jgi:hypothetical protein